MKFSFNFVFQLCKANKGLSKFNVTSPYPKGGRQSYLSGVKIRGLVPLRVFTSEITVVIVILVPFRIFSRKINMTGSDL